MPSALTRIEFEEGRKTSFLSLVISGRGSGYPLSTLSKEAAIRHIRNEEFTIISKATKYQYDDTGKIEKSFSINDTPGIGKFTSYDEYAYGTDQVLEQIRTFDEDGTSRLTYSRIPQATSPESLIADLAEALASLVAESLVENPPAQPIELLELNYHYADVYEPYLFCLSMQEVAEKLSDKEFSFIPSDFSSSLDMDFEPVEDLFAQLEQMMEDQDNMDLGRKMLQRAAGILNRTKLFGKLKTTEDFGAYAADWTLDGHSYDDLVEIFQECGIEESVIAKWRNRGMLGE